VGNGNESSSSVNVEFEVRRDYLKNFVNTETSQIGVFDSMDDLLRRIVI